MLKAREENMCWWIELGYPPFSKGKGGFPRTGQVIKHYREASVDDDGHAWTQKRLAEVLKLTDKTIGEIENRDAFVDFERRQFLSDLFDVPPVLLGIITQTEIEKLVEEHRATHSVSLVVPTVPHISTKLKLDVEEYTAITGSGLL
jgi:transcriptional regulator with XRE-family HTH domain